MPVRTYEKKGYAVQTYDLSLASGRTKFLAEVMVTIPRGEKDGEEVMFLTKDPETGKEYRVGRTETVSGIPVTTTGKQRLRKELFRGGQNRGYYRKGDAGGLKRFLLPHQGALE